MYKYAAAALTSFALAATPLVVSAQTITPVSMDASTTNNASLLAQLQAQLQTLLDQIHALESATAATQSGIGILTVAEPTSQTVSAGQQNVPFTALDLINTTGQPITISLGVMATGTAAQSDIASIVLAGSSGAPIASAPLAVSGTTTIGSYTIAASSSQYVMLGANMASTLDSGKTIGLSIVSINTTPSTAVSGTLPLTGAIHTTNSASVVAPPALPSCLALTVNLFLGSRDGNTGGQVTQLQQFLASQGFFNQAPTGYFGVVTENALQGWQSAHGIVSVGSPSTTGFGYAGPLTRSAIQAITCGGSGTPISSPVGGAMTATPTSGPGPLSVTFSGTAPGTGYTIDFGDGSAPLHQGTPDSCNNSSCAGQTTPVSATHTYQNPGTYVASLIKGSQGAVCTYPTYNANNPLSLLGALQAGGCAVRQVASVVSSVTIMVSGGTSASGALTIAASPSTVAYGGTSTVSWSGPAGASCVLSSSDQTNAGSSVPFGAVAASGSTNTSNLTQNSTYTVTCGSEAASVTVFVTGASIALGAPSNLQSMCSTDGTQVTLTWTRGVGNTNFLLRVNDPANDSPSCSDGWDCPNTDDYNNDVLNIAYALVPVVPGTQYQWWVVPANNVTGQIGQTVAGADFTCTAQ